MSKVTLNDLASLANEASAIASINSNNTALETAFENTLSRDGTSPNTMGANIDMNSNRVLNLPEPVADQEPLRLIDYLNSVSGVSLAGHVRTSDLSNTTDTSKGTALVAHKVNGTSSSGVVLRSKLEKELISVKDFGAVGDGATNDTPAFQAAINYAAGRKVFVPFGQYLLNSGVSYSGVIHLEGEGNGCGPGSASISNSQATQLLVNFSSGDVITATTIYPCIFKNLQFNTNPSARPRTSGATIYVVGAGSATNANTKIENCGFTEQYDCIKILRPAYPVISGCYADTFKHSFVHLLTSTGVEGSGGSILNNYVFGVSGSTTQQAGIITQVGYVRISENIIIGANYGIQVYIDNYDAGSVRITDNFIENQGGYGVYFGTASYKGAMFTVHRNEFSNYDYTASYVSSITVDDYSSGTDWLTDLNISDNVHRHSLTGNRYIWIKSGQNVLVANEQMENLGAGGSTIGIDLSTSVTAALKGSVIISEPQFVGTFGGGKILVTSASVVNYTQGLTFATLPSSIANGSRIWVTDGTAGTSPLAGSGSGCWAIRMSSAWHSMSGDILTGGTVTQATSKSTGVTLNTRSGAITMNNAGLTTFTTVGFVLTNSTIGANDLVVVAIKSGATANAYQVAVGAISAGSCRIEVRNNTAGTLSEALVLSFRVIRGSTT
jgi:hypothetical protein